MEFARIAPRRHRPTRHLRPLIRAGLLLAMSASAALGGEDWMRFRGPNGSATSVDANVPVEWSDTKNMLWKTELPGPGTSSPIVVGGKVYLTCFSGYNETGRAEGQMAALKRSLLCFDRKSGKTLWRRDLKVVQPEQDRIRDGHGYASSTPVSDGEGLWVFCGKSGVFAFGLDGSPRWQASVGSKLSGWGSAASPILYKDLVIVNASVESESLIAMDKKTGKVAWRARAIKEAWNTPLLVAVKGGADELVVAVPRKVIGLDPKTGKQLWTCDTDISWYMVPSAVAHDGIVYCIGGRSGKAGSLAVRAGGRGDVTKTHRLWRSDEYSNVSSPVYHEGRLYFAHEQRAVAYCLDAKTGKVVYEKRLEPRAGQVYPSPVLAGGRLYYLTRRSGVFVVPVGPEFKIVAHNTLPDRSTFNSSPAVSGSHILIRSDTYLYCLGKKP